MALAQNASTTVGLLINNPAPLPDGTVSNPNVQTVAAAGTTQATATPLLVQLNVVSNNTAANGLVLPVGTKGQTVAVMPALATNAPKIYPPLGGTINFGTVNASVAAPAQRETTFRAVDTTGLNWVSSSLTA